ncbi:MAG TPA: hemerythrin domain-containing protein [Lacipirellulaceae bacterium]
MATIHETSSLATSWMEHTILDHIKQALRVTLDWQAPVVSMPRKLSSLQFTMKSFRRHLERVMSIEEEGGYLSDIVEARPSMQSRIECLARDHIRFRARIRQLVPELDELNDWEEARFGEVCDEIRALLHEVDCHDAQEIDLLQESLLHDDGGEG